MREKHFAGRSEASHTLLLDPVSSLGPQGLHSLPDSSQSALDILLPPAFSVVFVLSREIHCTQVSAMLILLF